MDKSFDLRTTFNKDAERYNRYRPHYPQALLNSLFRSTSLSHDSKTLEIGPGTGQATEPIAKTGCEITAIELGANLANKARLVLKKYPNVRILTGSFEDVNLPELNFDLIFSATAFHWIKDDYKFSKTAALLKPKGYLAIIHTEHVSEGNGDNFYWSSMPIYEKYWPTKTPAREPLPTISQLKAPHIDKRLFELISFDNFPETVAYSAKDYVGLISTYSPTIALPPKQRQKFLSEIENLINDQFDGKVKKRFAFTLAIAQKK